MPATRRPMNPNPTMPTVLPDSSVPSSAPSRRSRQAHPSRRSRRSPATIRLASAIIRPTVCSATGFGPTPALLTTGIPAAVAAATSMLSNPAPAVPMTRSRDAAAITSRVIRAGNRTSTASASRNADRSRSGAAAAGTISTWARAARRSSPTRWSIEFSRTIRAIRRAHYPLPVEGAPPTLADADRSGGDGPHREQRFDRLAQRQADHVRVRSVDPLHHERRPPLNPVGAGLVEGTILLEIRRDLPIAQRLEGDARAHRLDVHPIGRGVVHRHAGDNLVHPSGKRAQHPLRIAAVAGLAQRLRAPHDHGV